MHLAALAPLHCDPFDRLLVAQAIQHGLTIATIDPEIAAYSGTVAARPDSDRSAMTLFVANRSWARSV